MVNINYLLGIDIGTSSTKVLLMSIEGEVIATEVSDYNLNSPKVKWAEENPENWWDALKICVGKINKFYVDELKSVKAIGLSGQMHGAVFVDKTGKALYPCIVWADNRTEKECQVIKSIVGEKDIGKITGNPIIPAYTAPKILWFKENRNDLYKKTYKVLMPKDYIGYKLTSTFYTDYSDASGTLLFDIKRKCWSEKIFEKLQLDLDKHPRILNSSDIIGSLTKKAAKEIGLEAGIPVMAGCGDLASAAIGSANFVEGIASINIGTAGQVIVTMDRIYDETIGKTFNFCHAISSKYFTLASVLSAGLALKWFMNNISLIENIVVENTSLVSFDILLEGIENITPGAKGLIFLPYLNGAGTPYLDDKARGVFAGLTSTHTKKEMVRSIIEGVTFGIRECLETITNIGLEVNEVVISAGGAKNPKWRQIQADIYNKKVSTLQITDTSPFGAAILASIGYGKFKDIKEASSFYVKRKEELLPNKEYADIYNLVYSNYKKIYPALKGYFNGLIDYNT